MPWRLLEKLRFRYLIEQTSIWTVWDRDLLNAHRPYLSYSLNSLNGLIQGTILGTSIGPIEGDTRRLDYSSLHEL